MVVLLFKFKKLSGMKSYPNYDEGIVSVTHLKASF